MLNLADEIAVDDIIKSVCICHCSIWVRTWKFVKHSRYSIRHGYDSKYFFESISLRKFWFDSTHDSQWFYRNWFKSAHDSKWISENWFKSIHDRKVSRTFLFKSTHDSKKSRILIQINSWLKKLGILILIESWLNDSNQLLISLTFSWAFTQFRWPFLGFHSISFIFFGFSINFVDLFGAFN